MYIYIILYKYVQIWYRKLFFRTRYTSRVYSYCVYYYNISIKPSLRENIKMLYKRRTTLLQLCESPFKKTSFRKLRPMLFVSQSKVKSRIQGILFRKLLRNQKWTYPSAFQYYIMLLQYFNTHPDLLN